MDELKEDKVLAPEVTEQLEEQIALDDARRVKVLSPSALVAKRFFRNKLAIIGLIILVIMFAFSFIGGLLTPYDEAQVFKGESIIPKEFAGAILNNELRYTPVEGEQITTKIQAAFALALSKGVTVMEAGDEAYSYTTEAEDFYLISRTTEVLSVTKDKIATTYRSPEGVTVTEAFRQAAEEAIESNAEQFIFDEGIFVLSVVGKTTKVYEQTVIGLATKNIYDAVDEKNRALVTSFDFMNVAEHAVAIGAAGFTFGNASYTLSGEPGNYEIFDAAGNRFGSVSRVIVRALAQDVTLTADFKEAARDAVIEQKDSFASDGTTYTATLSNGNYIIKHNVSTLLIRTYEAPSKEHWLGLDNAGMDLLTRLMYGGRVSLMVGFVVVFIEIFIGVIIGGISGYFGGWVDTAMMRFVDLFNSIPFWPIVLITGSVMDSIEVNPRARIFFLMLILGVLGWTGIARVVRGQILSLREQDFMVATEATGIRVSRRIFKHLIPNVMPLLIVQATMGLGGVIISEATLSFLGVGVKFPLASWGNIINAAQDQYVMSQYWFVWIPAGCLILLSVLGFNFVGDGLRDAFDPKMKR